MMFRRIVVGIAIVFSSLGSVADDPPSIDELSWLAGEWLGEGREGEDGAIQGVARQHWSPPLEGSMSYLFTWHDASSGHVHYAINVFQEADGGVSGKGIHYGRDFATFEDHPWSLELTTASETNAVFRCTEHCRSESVTFTLRNDGTMEERWRLNAAESKPDWIVVYRRPGTDHLYPGDDITALDQALSGVARARESGDLDRAQDLLTPLLDADVDQIPVRLEQARIHAARGNDDEAIRWLGRTLNLGGNTAWPAVRDEEVFANLKNAREICRAREENAAMPRWPVDKLAYLAGAWSVTARANPHGPKEYFNVEESIEGCAYIAVYGTTAGYKYTSLIFYDGNTDTWHQRGVDNQGFPMHMEGKFEGDELVLRYEDSEYQYKSAFREISADEMHNEIHRSGDNGETWENFFRGEFVRAN